MSIRGACAVVFAATMVMTLGGLPGREHAVFAAGPGDVGDGRAQRVERLEAQVAAHPTDSLSRTSLAKAYLEAGSPGLAWHALDATPAGQRREPAIEHMAARVLIEQGKARQALALERSVLATCGTDGTGNGCDTWTFISATRRADILQELVQQGIEDAIAQPEASLVAYHNATHEARLAVAE